MPPAADEPLCKQCGFVLAVSVRAVNEGLMNTLRERVGLSGEPGELISGTFLAIARPKTG